MNNKFAFIVNSRGLAKFALDIDNGKEITWPINDKEGAEIMATTLANRVGLPVAIVPIFYPLI